MRLKVIALFAGNGQEAGLNYLERSPGAQLRMPEIRQTGDALCQRWNAITFSHTRFTFLCLYLFWHLSPGTSMKTTSSFAIFGILIALGFSAGIAMNTNDLIIAGYPAITAAGTTVILGGLAACYVGFIARDKDLDTRIKLLALFILGMAVCVFAACLDKEEFTRLVGFKLTSNAEFARLLCSKVVELVGTGLAFFALSETFARE